MKREIKFRGKRLDTGKWVYGSLYQNGELCYIILQPEAKNLVEKRVQVDPTTVGQRLYGNSPEMYEDDIVRLRSENRLPSWLSHQRNNLEGTYVVVWSYHHFAFRRKAATYSTSDSEDFAASVYMGYKTSVLGNIHDNLELLR